MDDAKNIIVKNAFQSPNIKHMASVGGILLVGPL
jgi:hypothetical protein